MKHSIIVMFRSRSRLAFRLAFGFALILNLTGVEAATFTVNTTDDTSDADLGDGIAADLNGKCSLRAAIMQANFTSVIGPSNTIIIPAGVYTLTRPGDDDNAVLGDLDITQPMTIQGAGAGLTIIDGNGAVTGDRVIQILSSAKETSLSGMTIRNGKKINIFDEGGGLYWEGGGGHLHLSDMIFENNAAYYGGGLYLNYSSGGDTVEMDHVIIRSNTATNAAAGGLGASFYDAAGFHMRNSQVYDNKAYEGGGISFQSSTSFGLTSVRIETTDIYSNTAVLSAGIENRSRDPNVPVLLLNSRVHGNAAGYYGGAIGNFGTLTIANTTIDANSAGARGGGIYIEGATVSLTNSTISGNSVTNGSGGGIFNGVAVLNVSSTLNLINCTIASNNAVGGFGGGITNQSGNVGARSTIIAGNAASSGPDFAGVLNTINSSYDIFGNTGGLSFSAGIPFGCQLNVNPKLGPLQDNGGPTFTHALLTGSPAIDAAGASLGLRTDQRGAPRAVDDLAIPNANSGDGTDIGAFEFAQPQLAIQQADSAAVLSWPAYYGGFTLQSVANPILSNGWATVAGTPVVSGDHYVFTNSPISGNQFYRLKGD